jgi:glutaredoxin
MTHGGPLPIQMYARPDCEDSELARERLRALGIPFIEINIDEDEEAARYVERLNRGFRSTPHHRVRGRGLLHRGAHRGAAGRGPATGRI